MTGRPTGRVVTLTANPSLDRTLVLPAPLLRGEVTRLGGSSTEPGGKGVNVARALAAAGVDAVCVFPAASGDPFVGLAHALGLRVILFLLVLALVAFDLARYTIYVRKAHLAAATMAARSCRAPVLVSLWVTSRVWASLAASATSPGSSSSPQGRATTTVS